MHKTQKSRTNSLPPPAHRRGFTLMELIVVMAVIGVLVLLAAPKFLNYTARARETHIRNDIKVLESKIDEYLINHGTLPEEWDKAVSGGGQLYDRTGPINSFPSGDFKVVDKTFYPETNLDGSFYSDGDGVVIYEDDKLISEVHPPATEGIKCSLLRFEVDGPIPVSLADIAEDLENFSSLKQYIAAEILYLQDGFEEELGFYKVKNGTEVLNYVYVGYNIDNEWGMSEVIQFMSFEDFESYLNQYEIEFPGYTHPFFNGERDLSDGFIYSEEVGSDESILPKYYANYDYSPMGGGAIVNDECYMPQKPDEINIFAFDKNTGTILGFNIYRNPYLTDIIIPDTIDGVEVKRIADNAFKYGNLDVGPISKNPFLIEAFAFDENTPIPVDYGYKLTSVIIPDTVTEIGKFAFAGNEIITLVLGDSVKHIGDYAFEKNSLTSLKMGNSLETIGKGAFRENHIQTLDLGNLLKTIEENAFRGNRIETLNLSDSAVESVGIDAFSDNEITSLELGSSITTIGDGAFSNNLIVTLDLRDSVLNNIPEFAFYGNSIENLYLGDSVEIIGEYAFAYNTIKIVDVPSSVKEIKAGAFEKNYIDKITVKSDETIIDKTAFAWNHFDVTLEGDSFESTFEGQGVYIYDASSRTYIKE